MIEGETLATGAREVCSECRMRVEPDVYLSGAGFYIGTRCLCGPYTRESGYYRSEVEAQNALEQKSYSRTSGYVKAPLTRR